MTVDYVRFQYAGDTFISDGQSISSTLIYVGHSSDGKDDYDAFYAAGPFSINALYVDPISGQKNSVMTCTKVGISPEKKGERVRRITYTFSSKSPPGGPKPSNMDPTLMLPRYVWRRDEKTKALQKDFDFRDATPQGKPIVNSAGRPFRTALMISKKNAVCVITRNELSYNAPAMIGYWDRVNSATFWGQPKGCVLCAGILATKVWQRFGSGTLGYWEISYELHFTYPYSTALGTAPPNMVEDNGPSEGTDGWVEAVLDVGNCVKSTAGTSGGTGAPAGQVQVNQLTDVNGFAMGSDHPLDGHGNLLSADDIANGMYHYRYFWIHLYADLNALNLPYPV